MIRRLGVIVVVTGLLLSATIGQAASAEANNFNEPVICLDPGHQLYGNNELEPIGPGAKEMKAKVTSGTRGVKTKKPEYVVTLEASLLMKAKLEALGYQVRMTRDTHEVDLSNKERAAMCNQARADLAVRVHADGDGSPKTKGISLLYPAWSEWSQPIFAQSKEAAQDVLNEVLAATGAASRGIVPRSDLSGFNWSKVPSILVEMGFMTNPEEDEKLSDAGYLDRLTQGVVNGINSFMATQTEGTEREQQGRIYLPETARLYESRNGKMIRTALSLTSQTVQTSAVWGNWRKVSTWAGDKWVDAGQMPIEVQKAERLLELTKDTAMYRSPLDKAPVGGLTPQKVQAYEQWNGWYSIDTWMGRVWIQADVQ